MFQMRIFSNNNGVGEQVLWHCPGNRVKPGKCTGIVNDFCSTYWISYGYNIYQIPNPRGCRMYSFSLWQSVSVHDTCLYACLCVCVCVCVRTHVPIIVCPCLWEETAFSPVVNFLVFVEFFYIFILLRVFKKRIWENNPLYNVSVDFWKLNAGLFFVFVFVFSKNCKEMEWLRIHTPIWNTCVSNNNK